jgi:hypothetical protein
MRTLQSKGSLFVMVKQRRLPFRTVVTSGAQRHSGLGKLHAMNIRVACFALRRCSFEIDVDEPDAWIRRFMASDTFRGRMSALQSKPRLGVVEPRELFPRLGRMAGLAPERLSIRSCLPPSGQ